LNLGLISVNQCPLLNEPSYGDLSCSNGNDFSSHCDVSCQEGYRFTNETRGLIVERDARNIQAVKVHCRADASWSVMHVPQCERKFQQLLICISIVFRTTPATCVDQFYCEKL